MRSNLKILSQYVLQVCFMVACVATLTLPAAPSHAMDQELERYTAVTITPERSAIHPGDEFTVMTTIKLAPHWHVYWKNPGDSGLPVNINWNMPEGFEISDIKWPIPDKISYDILVNYGYYSTVTLLQTITAPDMLPEGKLTMTADINMLVCNEICIPESDTVSIHLNDPDNLADDTTTPAKNLLLSARSKLPKALNGDFSFTEVTGDDTSNIHLTLMPEDRTLLSDATVDNLEFFPHDWGIIQHVAIPNVSINDGTITITHARGEQPLDDIETLKGILVIKGKQGENQGFHLTASQKKTTEAPIIVNPSNDTNVQKSLSTPTQADQMTWLGAIYLALIGGIILNLMPCVFPVLSMKALSLVKMGEKSNTIARTHGIAYTLGVVLSFLAVGGALLILKEAGSIIGWGFQLQSPIVVGVLAYLLFIVGLNLMGFFDFGTRLSNVGNSLTQGQSIGSSFFTGMLATIVATPCTAPFMGAAMGFALTQSALVSMSVFAALGFGLALPYLLMAFIPATRKILPRPGAWMDSFKQFLAFPMFASAIWLVWVVSQQSGSYGVLLVLLGMLSISFAVWMSRHRPKGLTKVIVRVLTFISLLLPLLSVSYLTTTSGHSSEDKLYKFGEAFSTEALSDALESDRPVFVEMTAAWCITCKINHSVALNTNSTKQLFEQENVHYLIGDWTNYDEDITNYLDAFERNGVPLYVYYGARDTKTKLRPQAVILPQVLTPSVVKEYIGNK